MDKTDYNYIWTKWIKAYESSNFSEMDKENIETLLKARGFLRRNSVHTDAWQEFKKYIEDRQREESNKSHFLSKPFYWWVNLLNALVSFVFVSVMVPEYLEMHRKIDHNLHSGFFNQSAQFDDMLWRILLFHNVMLVKFILSPLIVITTIMLICATYKQWRVFNWSSFKNTFWSYFIPISVNSVFLIGICRIAYNSLDVDYKIASIKWGIGLPSFLLPYGGFFLFILHNLTKENSKKIFAILGWGLWTLWFLWIGYIILKTLYIIPQIPIGTGAILWIPTLFLVIGVLIYKYFFVN